MGIGKTLEKLQLEQPTKPAIISKERSVTYKEFYEQVRWIKQNLRSMIGDEKGKK